jgi:hypothetical protein
VSGPLNVGPSLWPVWIAVGLLGVSSTRSCARIAEGQCATPAPTGTAVWRTRRPFPVQTGSRAPLELWCDEDAGKNSRRHPHGPALIGSASHASYSAAWIPTPFNAHSPPFSSIPQVPAFAGL